MSDIRDFILGKTRGLVYTPLMDEMLIAEEKKKRDTKRKKGLYPSSLAHPCLRYIINSYNQVEAKKKIDPRILRIFDMGNAVHKRYEIYSKKMGVLIKKEFPLRYKKLKIRGRLDQLLLIENVLYLFECKSMKDEKWKKLFGVPPQDYRIQVQLYLLLLNMLFKERKNKFFEKYGKYFPIKKSILFIEDKDNQKTEEIIIEENEEQKKYILDKIEKINYYINKNIEPPLKMIDQCNEYGGCCFKHYCYGENK